MALETPASSPSPLPSTDADPAADLAAGSPAAILEDVGASILAEAPEVSPEFVAKKRAAAGMVEIDPDTQAAPLKDRRGYIFDPKFCRVNRQTGEPVFSAGGSFEMRTAKDGKRYRREDVLRRRVFKARAPQADPLELPPEFAADEAAPQAAPQPGADPAAGMIDPRQMDAENLAFVCDQLFWSASTIVADAAVVQEYQARISEAGRQALAAGFQTMEEVPKIPWYVMAGLIYAPALAGMMAHEKSRPKRQWLKDKFAILWLKIRGGGRRPVESYEPKPRPQASAEAEPQEVY